MRITKEQLLEYYDRVAEPAELIEYAAANAAQELATNWATALKDGDSIEVLVHDVERVIRILQAWKAIVADKLGE